jgi:hypothetical protein
MAEKLLGLHEGCGGSVYETDNKILGGRICNLCGAIGVEALLMSEIFCSDDLTPVALVPADEEIDGDGSIDIDVEEFSDEIEIKVGAKGS